MFNIDSSEFLLVAIVALVVIGPKDLPKAMRVVGYWVGKARGVSRQFRQGFDNMVREAELAAGVGRRADPEERDRDVGADQRVAGRGVGDGAGDRAGVLDGPGNGERDGGEGEGDERQRAEGHGESGEWTEATS